MGGDPISWNFTYSSLSSVNFNWMNDTYNFQEFLLWLWFTFVAASPVPGWVPIIVESQDDIQLGQTGIYYEDPVEGILEQLVFDPTLQRRLFDKYNTFMRLGSNLQTSGAGAQQSETLG